VPKTKACGYWIAAFAGDDNNENQTLETTHHKIQSDILGFAASAMLKRDQ
jgi:hypothetical protein